MVKDVRSSKHKETNKESGREQREMKSGIKLNDDDERQTSSTLPKDKRDRGILKQN